ncbi:MAG: hypothetical protein HC884_01905 [Chloroflexaceae bacterium]|nr:hypothetical protein [Chloroflexaceae bacterium]
MMWRNDDVDLSHLSARDRGYVESPSFETHIISGFVFAVGFTIAFMVPVMIGMAYLFWPGIFVATAISLYVMRVLQKREFFIKLREVEENPIPDPEE